MYPGCVRLCTSGVILLYTRSHTNTAATSHNARRCVRSLFALLCMHVCCVRVCVCVASMPRNRGAPACACDATRILAHTRCAHARPQHASNVDMWRRRCCAAGVCSACVNASASAKAPLSRTYTAVWLAHRLTIYELLIPCVYVSVCSTSIRVHTRLNDVMRSSSLLNSHTCPCVTAAR